MKRIAIGVEYNGACWQGWQTQPHRLTVQDALEAALQEFTQTRVPTVCAGRTDRGVHALEQVVHFDTPLERPLSSWVRGVNSFLPSSIAVHWACEVGEASEDGFHARFSAIARTYRYLVYNNPVRSPLLAGRVGWVFRPLAAETMRDAAAHLIGTHDFSAFRAAECQSVSPIRNMEAIGIERRGDILVFTLRANAFLHHMVRNIVGSLVLVGQGSRPSGWIGEVLAGRDRSLAAPTFSPDGLYLARVDYGDRWRLPHRPGPLDFVG